MNVGSVIMLNEVATSARRILALTLLTYFLLPLSLVLPYQADSGQPCPVYSSRKQALP